MPENPAGLGFPEEKLVHFTKRESNPAKCEKCGGYQAGIDVYCPRCIAKGKQHKLQNSGRELFCLECRFHCFPNNYEIYRGMSQRFVCHCDGKAKESVAEQPITKLF
jgi:hypothetical protein